jgi:hypothetical protein
MNMNTVMTTMPSAHTWLGWNQGYGPWAKCAYCGILEKRVVKD